MPNVRLSVGGRSYDVFCPEGDEEQISRLAHKVDGCVRQAQQAMGSVTEGRQLLFAALMLADEAEGGAPSPPQPSTGGESSDITLSASEIDSLAERVEALAKAITG